MWAYAAPQNPGRPRTFVGNRGAGIEVSGSSNSDIKKYIHKFSELPEEHRNVLQNIVPNALEQDEYLEIIVRVLHFTAKLKLRVPNARPSIDDKDIQQLDDATNALTSENAWHTDVAKLCLNDTKKLIMAASPTFMSTVAKKQIKVKDQAGKGGFGVVFEGQKNKLKIAIKKMPHVTRSERHKNLREVAFLHHLVHNNIVKYEGAIIADSELWLLMEWMDGGTLHQALSSKHTFDEPSIAYVVREMLKGLEHMHAQGIIHRDLKSKNVMLSVQGNVKLIDFGLCVHEENAGNKMMGSAFWIAPEMIKCDPTTSKSDIWACGIIILEMLNKKPPHHKSRLKAMYCAATRGVDLSKLKCSPMLKSFLEKCLQVNPDKRASVSELLKDAFLQKCATSSVIQKVLSGIFMVSNMYDSGVF